MTRPSISQGRYSFLDGRPRVSYHGTQVAAAVLEGIAAHYIPLYGLSLKAALPHFPLLGFVEALLVQAEVAMEEAAAAQLGAPFAAWEQAKLDIRELLVEAHLDHAHITYHLTQVEAFFQLVHELKYLRRITPENVARAVELAPADYRLLHAILCCLLGQPCDDSLFAGMRALEVLRDFHWYLGNYENDLREDHYNIFVIYARLYGEQAVTQILAEQHRYESQLADCLQAADAGTQRRLAHQVAAYRQALPDFATQLLNKLGTAQGR